MSSCHVPRSMRKLKKQQEVKHARRERALKATSVPSSHAFRRNSFHRERQTEDAEPTVGFDSSGPPEAASPMQDAPSLSTDDGNDDHPPAPPPSTPPGGAAVDMSSPQAAEALDQMKVSTTSRPQRCTVLYSTPPHRIVQQTTVTALYNAY